eukprot:m.357516 g.357516  ORF g.357516 m.357516 type:complete len:466 (+) comp17860_c0_seq1:99-1496(+)
MGPLHSRARPQITPSMSLADAAVVHTEAWQTAHRNMRLHGHQLSTTRSKPTAFATSFATSSFSEPCSSKRTIVPSAFGADPTGIKDSTEALQSAMSALLNFSCIAKASMVSNITDLGGSTLDLEGGQYLISDTIVVPQNFGNLYIVNGKLKASPTFPSSKYLLSIGSESCNGGNQGSCNEYVNIANMMFDASHVAAGGVYIAKTMGATIQPAFFIGYQEAGLNIVAGHEVMVFNSWFAQYYWSEAHPPSNQLSGVGISINGNDHYVTNTIVFDFSKVGVYVGGAANVLHGVHTWNGGGVGIFLGSNRNRLTNCYLDYNYLEVEDPNQHIVESTFFLDTKMVLTAKLGTASQFIVKGNSFTVQPSIQVNGTFNLVDNVVVADNIECPKNTRATKKLTQTNSDTFTFDFSDVLLFRSIDTVLYSVSADKPVFVNSYAQTPNGTTVTVKFQSPVSASVTMSVAQGVLT